MAVTMERYHLSSYTNNTWTQLAAPGAGVVLVIRNLVFCNSTTGALNVSVRITESNGTTVRSQQVATYSLAAKETLVFGPQDLLVVLKSEEQLQVKASGAGVNFYAGGGYE